MLAYFLESYHAKSVVIFLIASLCLGLPLNVLAQEDISNEPPVVTETLDIPLESPEDTSDPSFEGSFQEVLELGKSGAEEEQPSVESSPPGEELMSDFSMEKESDEPPPEMEMDSFGGGDESPTLQSQSAFTYANVTPKVDNHSGALTQRIGLDIPPGRKGMQPNLALEYNSQNAADSIIGYGWTISIPYIERMNKTGSQSLYGDRPYFSSSIDGELATSSDGIYRAKVDEGSFTSYTYSGNTWIAYDKKGTKYSYGLSDQSRQASSTEMAITGRWMLEEIRDTNDNYVRYVYTKHGNQIYPSQIIYTGNGITDGNITIDFASSTRPDPFTSYKLGFRVDTNYRITQITTSIGSDWVRKFDLTYGSGNNGLRSLLTSIQETGKDSDNAEISLPAMTFGYVSSSTAFVTPSYDNSVKSSSWVVSDANGDARSDVTVMSEGGGTPSGNVLQNQTSNISLDTVPVFWCSTSGGYDTCPPKELGIRYLDVNADGKADIAQGLQDNSTPTTTKKLYINSYATSTGYAWTASTTWAGVIPEFGIVGGGAQSGGIFGEVNGDGLPDFEHTVHGLSLLAHLGNGSAWDAATTTIFQPLKETPDLSGGPQTNSQLVDINGDGLDDWVYSDSTTTYVHLNYGKGWLAVPDSRWTIATSTYYKHASYPGYWDRGMRFTDINGDGLPDFIRSYRTDTHTLGSGASEIETADIKYVYLNTGSGWATSTIYTLPEYVTTGRVITGVFHGEVRYNEYANWIGNGQMNQDVISQISYSSGGSTAVTYTPTASMGTNPLLPISLLAVTKLVTTDVLGNSSEKSYAYSNGKMYLTEGPRERKFAGFNTITETRPDAIVRTYFNQGDGASTGDGEQSDGFAQINHPYREDILDPTGATTLQKTFFRWDATSTAQSMFVGLGSKMVSSVNSNGSHKDRATEYTYSTTTRDLVQQTDYGEVNGSSDGTSSDTGTDKRTATIAYAASSSVNLSVPMQNTLTNYFASTTRETKLYYDSLALGLVGKGNETKRENWISDSLYASSTRAYSAYGLVASSTDPRGKVTTYAYDGVNFYPATVTNPLSQATTYTYDYATGEVLESTDPNGRKTKNVYDAVGRVKRQDQSDLQTPSSYVTKTVFTYVNSTTTPSSVQRTDYLNAASTTETYQYSDGLGHIIQRRSSSGSTGTTTVSNVLYNAVGLAASSTLPYFSSGTSYAAPTTTVALYIYATYDALQRPIVIRNSIGAATTTYADWSSTVTDPNAHSKKYYYDAFRNLVQVDEISGANTYSTLYTYDAAGNLTKITDSLANVRNFTYDGLSRRLTVEDLHAVADGTYGVWSYSYDDAGNLLSHTDPKSQVVNRTYDDLGRMLTEDYAGAANIEVTNIYDSCTYGIGNICSAASASATSTYIYDVLGRVVGASTTIQSIEYGLAYVYDRLGNVTTLVYPDGRSARYVHNDAVLPSSFETKPLGGSYAPVVSNLRYGPDKRPTFEQFNNGVESNWTYSPTEQYRLKRILTGLNAATSSSASSSPLVTNIVSYWKMDESSGAAADAAGTNTLTNNSSASFATGKINNGGDLERSSSQYFSISDGSQSGLDLTSALTFALWVKFESIPTSNEEAMRFIYKYDDNAGNANKSYYFSIIHLSGALKLYSSTINDDCTSASSQNWSPSTDTWYHVAMTYDAGTVKQYINGSQLGSTFTGRCSSIRSGGAQFNMGGQPGGSSAVDGMIDEVGVWSRALSDAEIAEIYASGAGLQYPFSASSTSAGYASLIQDRNYSYDAVGNITEVIENATSTDTGMTLALGYDALNRLTAASTTAAASAAYARYYAYDPLGNILDATSTSGANSSGGNNSHSISFDRASSQYLSHAHASAFNITGDYTIESWIKLDSLPSSGQGYTIAGKWGGDGGWAGHSYVFQTSNESGTYKLSSSVVRASCTSGNGAAVTWTPSVNTWYHVSVNYVASTRKMQFFVNGAQQGTDQTPDSESGTCENTTSFRVGGGPGTPGHFDGLIDDVRLYNVARTGTQIASDYDEELAGSESNLRAYYQLNGDYDDLTTDDNDLTPTNSPTFSGNVPFGGGAVTYPYLYEGTSYANPHAPTSVYGTTYAYDNNGNLATTTLATSTNRYTWDYANRMVQSVIGAATTTYGYDYTGQRVFSQTASTTTVFPSKYFSVTSTQVGSSTLATSTSYVFANDQLVAYVEQNLIDGTATGTPRTFYVHPDHLGSTNVTTTASGTVQSVRDFFPFGSTRVQSGNQSLGRGYIGEFQDSDDFSYLNNRYYRSSQGQFISEDPVHLAIGSPQQVQALTGRNQQAYLADPQLLNSYSYGRNNPIVNKDPQGTCPICILGLGLSGGYLYGLANQYEYDQGRGQTSNVSSYVDSGVKGIFQGGAAAGSLMALGPATALEYYSYYQTYQGLRDFNEQILSNNSVNYNEQQQRMTAGQTWLDIVQRIASIFTPQPAKTGYDAANSILNSLIQISSQYSKQSAAPATQYVVQGNSTYARTSGGGLAPTSLPASVSQGGSTYYRNSSGLLSTTPGL